MNISQALEKIKRNWASYPHNSKDGHEAVWIVKDDIAGSYEVDEELIGMKGDGSLVWAYASGTRQNRSMRFLFFRSMTS